MYDLYKNIQDSCISKFPERYRSHGKVLNFPTLVNGSSCSFPNEDELGYQANYF